MYKNLTQFTACDLPAARQSLTSVIIITSFIQNVTVCKLSQASCLLLQDENASFLVVLMMMIILDDFCWAQKKLCRFYSPALSPYHGLSSFQGRDTKSESDIRLFHLHSR